MKLAEKKLSESIGVVSVLILPCVHTERFPHRSCQFHIVAYYLVRNMLNSWH